MLNKININYYYMYKNIIIVGTGWYGCYIAEFIIDNYPKYKYNIN